MILLFPSSWPHAQNSRQSRIFGLNVQDIGAQQTGMSVEAFKSKLLSAGA
jgi:hypothetical protein